MTANINCEVAVAMWTGKFNKRVNAGTWRNPPPTPKRLERKPTKILNAMPRTGL
jgi:hypothetical protein